MKNQIQKTFNFLVTLLIFTSLISSCKKDDDNSNQLPPSGSTLKTTIVGKVIDTDGLLVVGATVKLGTLTSITDNRGNFFFVNADVPKDRMVFTASKTGYFNSIYAKRTQSGEANYVNIMLQETPNASIIPGVAGGVVNIPGGAKITFPSNAFVDANGTAYTGNVRVFARHINPGASNFEAIVPGGDLSGVNALGQNQSLYPLGMIEALLFDNTGLNEIKLATGKTAELKFPIDPSQAAVALSTIPLWHLNTTNGKWIEEGEATKSGNFYIGNVSHFSTWNCDYSGPKTDIVGKVIDCQGNPVPGIVVTVNGFVNATTDNSGTFTTWVPAGYVITCQALMSNNPILLADSPIQTITAVGGVLNIVPPITISCATRIAGTIKVCGGAAISPATIYASWNGGSSVIYTATGNYILYVKATTQINIIATSGTFEGKKTVTSGAQGTISNVPELQLCSASTISQTSFVINSTGGGSTAYLVTTTSSSTDFVDSNADGVFESASINIYGKANPGNYNCNILINLTNSSAGNYSLLQNSQNIIQISMDSTWTYASGMPSGSTLNRMVFTDFASPGGFTTGQFEFNHGSGSVTEGKFSVLRQN